MHDFHYVPIHDGSRIILSRWWTELDPLPRKGSHQGKSWEDLTFRSCSTVTNHTKCSRWNWFQGSLVHLFLLALLLKNSTPLVSRSRCPSVSSSPHFSSFLCPPSVTRVPRPCFASIFEPLRPLTSRRIVIKLLCVFLAEYIRLSFRFSLVLEVMEGWRTRRGIYRRINCNSRAMCCGKSRLEGLETKETLLFNVDKLDRLYLNFRFQEIWKEFSRCSY